jgi:prevent-host-death family protein
MSRTITATEANRRFSEILRDVADGESFTVTSRGRSIARISPVELDDQHKRMKRLQAYVKTLPIRHSGDWTRADLYD